MAAEMILVKVGESVASIAVDFVTGQVQHYIDDHFQFQPAVEANLNRLVQDLQTIKAVLCEADKRRIENDELGKWLQAIKDATYDAEDVLDMFEYKIIQEKVEGTADDENNIFKRCFTCANSTVKKFIVSGDVVKKLNEVVDKFKSIADRSSGMFQLINSQPAVSQWVSKIMQSRVTTSTPIESKVFGRDEERAQLMKLLNQFSGDGGGSSSSRNFHVLPVVGFGGVGKTTLVQDVYNNQDVKHLFDLKAWVCVSDNFDVKRLTKEIIESASISKPPDFHFLENPDRIQQILQDGLKDKRFLIVLDDIWNENNTKWEQLQRDLNCGKDGSRVIVTTRNEKIAKMMGTKEAIHLEGLAKEEFWRFFKQCAFGDENPANHPELEFVGKQIAEKLKGIPLAAKTVGAMLRLDLNVEYWKEVLHDELWKTNEQEDGIMQALRLSYEYLPSYLKQCFVYCSLFPKDYRYEKTKLVRMWIAHGFILPSGQQILEKIGEAYFNELLSRSFIHEAEYKIFENEYVIHDLLHDLAQSLSDGEIYIAENDEAHISSPKKKVRHISICSNNLSLLRNNDKLGNENVRSLVVFNCSVEKTLDVLSELKGLRVLVLLNFPVELSLKFIQKMLHLRYLEISDRWGDDSFNMPESVCKLYHLQVLRPTKGIAWIGSLTLLQELKLKVNQGEKGFDIGQIRDMSELRRLCLKGLETVKTKEQASQAMLNNKKHLKDLKLEWEEEEEVLEGSQPHQNQNRLSNRRVPLLGWKRKADHHINLLHNEEDVLEGLQPHSRNLEKLVIKRYGGGGTPSWWNANWASNLITLKLWECSKWEFLPPLGHLPFLKVLEIYRMNAVRSIGSEFYASNSVGLSSKTIFPSLEEFYISWMPELKDWYKIEEEGGGGGGFELFPRLKNFRIGKCPQLRGSIFHFPPSNFNLITLELDDCSKWEFLPPLGHLPFLKVLEIKRMNAVRSIGSEFYASNSVGLSSKTIFPSLEELYISGMHELEDWYKIEEEEEGFVLFPRLKTFRIAECPKLRVSIFHFPPSNFNLITLKLWECSKWEFLPPLGHLPFLKVLHLRRMNAVRSIGSEFYATNQVQLSSKTIFPSLEEFYISKMPELKDWYKIEEGGGGGGGGFELFPRLKSFSIAECPQLRGSIFQFPPSNFNQIRVHISEFAFFSDDGTEGLIEVNCDSASRVTEWLPYPNLLTFVEHLTIEGYEMRSCFPTELVEWIQHLTSLHSLCFSWCAMLKSLPSNLISSLSTLRILKIKYCPNIKSLTEEGLPASLQQLLLEDCEKLESLPSNLISLSTLRILNIENCPKIKSLPEEGLPASIQELHVLNCYDLAKRCMKDDWQRMIAHIPTFTVDGEVVTEENRKSLQTFDGEYYYDAKEEDEEE